MNKPIIALGLLALAVPQALQASPILDIFTTPDWQQFQVSDNGSNPEDYVGSGGKVAPGWGGQAFDAEYLFYKFDGSVLSIGLQTGFDVFDGRQVSGNKWYYSGDLGLSFDNNVIKGDGTTYEYGIDFGLLTRDYDNDLVGGGTGINNAGVYQVSQWNNDVVRSHGYDFTASNPFAIESGNLLEVGFSQFSEVKQSGDSSFYRMVSFDTALISEDITGIDVHWTMSCGNDAINGWITPVRAPGSFALLLCGLVGVGIMRHRKTVQSNQKLVQVPV